MKDNNNQDEEDKGEEKEKEESKTGGDLQEKTGGKGGTTIFDPDNDGFNFGYEKATLIHKNMNILQFIRKNLLPNNCKHFEMGLEALQEQFNKDKNADQSNFGMSEQED